MTDVPRSLSYAEAIREAMDLCLAADPTVLLMGLGVPDPKGIFGSTRGLQARHGAARVFDIPCAEGGMTGVAIGTALVGMRPVMTHQRIDFALHATEQIVNQAAKWRYMFGGRMKVPLVVRMIVGRGWGQGPQHAQSLQALYAHIPGLRVLMPSTPHDAKGLLIAAIEDDDPVVVIEHRWLYDVIGPVPEGRYVVPIGSAKVVRPGRDATIAAVSYMTLEALRAADRLATEGIDAEVIDLRSLRPLDAETVRASVRKTGRLVVADTGGVEGGVSAEVVARVVEGAFRDLLAPPRRIGLPDGPAPSAPALAARYYPRAAHLVAAVREVLGRSPGDPDAEGAQVPLDIPDPSYTGPF